MQTKNPTFKTKANKHQAYRWLMTQSKQCRGWFVLSVFLGVTYGVLIIGQAYLLATILHDVAILKMVRPSLMPLMWWLLALIGIRSIVAWLREIVNSKMAIKIKQHLRQQIMEQLVAVGPVRLAEHQSGGLSTTLIEQVEGVHDFFANYLPQMMLVTILPLLILLIVFSINWMSGLILLLTAPLIPLFMAIIGMGAESKSQQQYQQLAKMSGHFLDVLRGLVTLKLFYQSFHEQKRIAKVSNEYRKTTMGVLYIAFMSSAVLELFSSIAIAIIAVYLGLSLLGLVHIGLIHNTISLKSALFILLLAPEFYLPLRQLGVHYHARSQAIAAAEEIIKIMELKKISVNQPCQSIRLKSSPVITFQNVSFSYSQDKRPLNQINFKVEAGEQLALIGKSGEGKSTLLNLLMRFLEPDEGNIHINQQNLSSIQREAWWKSIGWVGQNTRLIFGTIRENILLANPDVSTKALNKAIECASLDEWLCQLKHGIDTKIGDQNIGISQGQVQRIALCRAFIKDVPLLLLDEPTASLDQLNQDAILAALPALCKNKTVLTVTHRQQTMLQADRVIELKNGKISEVTINAQPELEPVRL